MTVIDGREFNLTQIGHNRYINNIKTSKEAQELAQLLRKLDDEVTVLNLDKQGRVRETLTFNRQNLSLVPPGVTVSNENGTRFSPGYAEYAYQEEVTADSAFIDNWSRSTGITVSHGVTFSVKDGADIIDSTTIDRSSVKYQTHYTRGCTTKNATVKNPAVKNMEQEEFLAYVRENGLDKEINWSKTEEYFKADAEFSSLSDYTDYAGALYASLEQRIQRDFSGEEQNSQLKILDNCFSTAMQEYSSAYSEKLCAVYEDFGVEIDGNKIKSSVISLMVKKKNFYSDYAEKNSDFANLAASEDKWLERDVKFMANALRNAYTPPDISTSIYNEQDLEVLGCFASQHQKDAGNTGIWYIGNKFTEESIGLALSMKYLASECLTEKWNTSGEVKNIIGKVNDNYKKEVIENCRRYLSSVSEMSGDYKAYGEFDEKIVDSIISKAERTFSSSRDYEKTLKQTSDYAYRLHEENRNDPVKSEYKRYNLSTDEPEVNFWHEFYDDGRGTSFLGKTLDKWTDYYTAVENRNFRFLKMIDNAYFFSYKTLLGGL